jgi:predicted DNA-binding WGR domain protein
MTTHLEYHDKKTNSEKFWEITVTGKTMTRRYGRVDTKPQVRTNEFDTPAAAKKEEARLIAEKRGKGYA